MISHGKPSPRRISHKNILRYAGNDEAQHILRCSEMSM
jgi:hypothetical protein